MVVHNAYAAQERALAQIMHRHAYLTMEKKMNTKAPKLRGPRKKERPRIQSARVEKTTHIEKAPYSVLFGM